MLVISFTVGMHETLFGGNKVVYPLMLFLSLMCAVSYLITNGIMLEKNAALIIWLMTLFPLFWNNQNIAHYSLVNATYEWGYVSVTILFICLSRTPRTLNWENAFGKVMICAGCFHAFVTLFSAVFPGVYKMLLGVLGSYSSDALYQYKQGLYPGLTPHYSTNGMYLALGVGACIGSLFASKKNKILHVILLLCVLTALLFTGKRAHIVFSAMVAFVMYYLSRQGGMASKLLKLIGVVLVSVTIFTIASSYVPQLNSVIYRFNASMDSGDISNGRSEQIATAIIYFSQNKILGIGWDAFKFLYQNASGVALNVHCVYAQLLCETGLLGFGLFIAFFILELIKCIKVLKNIHKRLDYPEQQVRNIYIAVFVELFFLLYCLTGNPLYDIQMFFPYMMSCALIEKRIKMDSIMESEIN